MRIGIDVGGTNTDAVLMDGLDVLGWRKTPTTPDVGSGIIEVLRELLAQTKVSAADVQAVMIGTTHFTNAIVERRRLVEVAAIRLGLPATRSLPPLTDWPADLASAVGRHRYMLRGGNEFDGREIARARRTGLTGSRQGHPAQGHHRRCDHLGVLAGDRSNGAARRRDPGRGSPGPPPVAFPRDRADRAARARERHRDERLPGRSRFRRRVVVPSGAARTRDRGAVLHQPERRHPDGAASRRALSRAHLRFGSDQFDARRGVARRLEGGDGGRHRRHHLRRRHADARIPARGGGVGRHRRRAHQFSHARRARDRARRRQPGARRGRAHRPRTRSATNSPAKRSYSAAIF